MHSHVLLFGGLNTAVEVSGDEITELRPGSTRNRITSGQLEFLKEVDHSYSEIQSPDSLALVERELEREATCRRAIFFTLATMDSLLDEETKRDAASLVDSYLSDLDTRTYVGKILKSSPLPAGSGQLPTFAELHSWNAMVAEVNKIQLGLTVLDRAWCEDKNGRSISDAEEDSDLLHQELVHSGTWERFASTLISSDLQQFNRLLVSFSMSPETRKRFPAAARTLTSFRVRLEKFGSFASNDLRLFATSEMEVPERRPENKEISRMDPRQAFEQVKKQIEGIKKILWTGNRQSLDRAVAELMDFHRQHGDKEHLAKSLCQLSASAIDGNEPHLADFLSSTAVELDFDDVVTYTTRADVLKHLGRFEEALTAYENVIAKYGKEKYALCGYADTLKDAGRLSDARKVYETALGLFEDDPVPYNGLAGVLFSQGKVEEAVRLVARSVSRFRDDVSKLVHASFLRSLGRYTESIKQLEEAHVASPSNPRIWSSLIRTLTVSGALDSALRQSEEFIRKVPDNPIAVLSRAECLVRAKRFEESLSLYTSALKQFPSHRPAQLGKASVLILLDRPAEAEEILGGLELESEIDWIAYHAYCLSLMRKGELSGAIARMQKAASDTPWEKVKTLFNRSLGFAYIRVSDPGNAIPVLQQALAKADAHHKGNVLLFMSSAYLGLGKTKVAATYWNAAQPTQNTSVVHSFLKRTHGRGLLNSAVPLQPEIEQEIYRDLLAA